MDDGPDQRPEQVEKKESLIFLNQEERTGCFQREETQTVAGLPMCTLEARRQWIGVSGQSEGAVVLCISSQDVTHGSLQKKGI